MTDLEKRLKRIADLLEYHLGDTDPNLPDDQDVLEDEFPVHAAMQLVVELMLAARATTADHISQARDAVIEECLQACHAQRIDDPKDRDDHLRNIASEDCWRAIRALKSAPPEKPAGDI